MFGGSGYPYRTHDPRQDFESLVNKPNVGTDLEMYLFRVKKVRIETCYASHAW